MNSPDDATTGDDPRSAYWQGVMGTKLDTVIEEVRRMNDGKEAEHAKINVRIDAEVHRIDGRIDRHGERIDSLETTRDRAWGVIIGVGLGSGLLSGTAVAAASRLIT